MALYFPLSEAPSMEGYCFGNFLTTKMIHMVVSDGNDLVFERASSNTSEHKPIRTRILANGSVLTVARIPAAAFKEKSNGLDALLLHSRSTRRTAANEPLTEDVLSIYLYNASTAQLDHIRSDNFAVPHSSIGSYAPARISVNELKGPGSGSILFSNGSQGSIYKIVPAEQGEVVELSMKSAGASEPTQLYWISDDLAVAVLESNFSSTLIFHDMTKPKHKSKQRPPLTKVFPERVKFVGPGVLEDSMVVMFSNGFQLLKYTKKGIKEDRELKFELKPQVRSWYFLSSTSSGDSFYISSLQELLLLRPTGNPVLLEVQNGVPGSIRPLGAGVFEINAENETQFCRFRLNKKRTNIVADFIGSRSKPLDELILTAQSIESHSGKKFWWKRGVDNVQGSLFVTQPTIDVTRRSIPSHGDGSISDIWSISSGDTSQVLVSSSSDSFVGSFDGEAIIPIAETSWRKLDHKTLFADENIQITPFEIITPNKTVQALPEITMAASSGQISVVANNSVAKIFIHAEEVKSITTEETILDVHCNDKLVSILTANCLHLFDSISLSLEEHNFEEFCTKAIVLPNNKVFVGTIEGGLISVDDRTKFNVSISPVKELYGVPSDVSSFIVTDALSNSYLIDKDCRVIRFSQGGLNRLVAVSTVDGRYVTSANGTVDLVEFDGRWDGGYRTTQIPSAPGAQTIFFRDSELYELHWDTREVHIANINEVLNPRKYLLPSENQQGESLSQLFALNSSHILEVASKQPEDVASDSELEDDDAAAFFEVPILVRLYKLVPEKKYAQKLNEQQITLAGDPYDEIIVKFISSEERQMHHFYLFTQSSSAAYGEISTVSGDIQLFDADPHMSEEVYYDHWLLDDKNQKVVIVDQGGRVVEVDAAFLKRVGQLAVDLLAENGAVVSRITDFDRDMVFQVIELNNSTDDGTRVFAAAVKQSDEKVSRVIVFSSNGGIIRNLANIHIANRKISLIKSVAKSAKSDHCAPEFYIGTSNGGLYAVSTVTEETLRHSLETIQISLLQEMGFVERLQQLQGSFDGKLLLEALITGEFDDIFVENNVSKDLIFRTLNSLRT